MWFIFTPSCPLQVEIGESPDMQDTMATACIFMRCARTAPLPEQLGVVSVKFWIFGVALAGGYSVASRDFNSRTFVDSDGVDGSTCTYFVGRLFLLRMVPFNPPPLETVTSLFC